MTREEAITRLKNMAWLYGSAEREQNIKAIDMAIESLSAERVIRCKDCRYYNNDYMGKWCGRHQAPVWVKESDFCSWAKMKGGAE